MKTGRLLSFLLLAMAAMLACGLIACGDDDDDDSVDDDAGDDDAADDDDDDDDVADDDDDNDTADDDDDTSTALFNITFDDYAADAPPPAPWVVYEDVAGSVLVVADPTKKDGNVLEILGDAAAGVHASATYPFTVDEGMTILHIAFWLYHADGAAFGFILDSEEQSWVIELLNDPVTGEYYTYGDGDAVTCGTLAGVGWYTFDIILNLVNWNYDIRINGGDTLCAGVTTIEDTITGGTFVDWLDDGFGGTAYYDYFAGLEY
jgi:hypothetical protein